MMTVVGFTNGTYGRCFFLKKNISFQLHFCWKKIEIIVFEEIKSSHQKVE